MIRQSIFLSLTRQLLILVPLIYVLPIFMGADGVWWSFPISDLLAFVMAVAFGVPLVKKMRRTPDGADPSVFGGKIQ